MKRDITIFDSYQEKENIPMGPYFSISAAKRILYFDGAASDILRKSKATHVQMAVDRKGPAGLCLVAGASDKGALKLRGGTKGKGPGTYQLGAEVFSYFETYGMRPEEKQRVPLKWCEDVRGFEFDLPEAP